MPSAARHPHFSTNRLNSLVAAARARAQDWLTYCSRAAMNASVSPLRIGHRLSRAKLRRRWEQLADDPLLAAIPFKVELNEKGAIEISPPTGRRAALQAHVAHEVNRHRPDGATFIDYPVETEIGLRIPDVAWASAQFMALHGNETVLRAAPELCVELLCPTHTRAEIADKVAAYLGAGALEVWLIAEEGAPEIYTHVGRVSASKLGFELSRAPLAG
jgi:Uma2 family endonuclease